MNWCPEDDPYCDAAMDYPEWECEEDDPMCAPPADMMEEFMCPEGQP